MLYIATAVHKCAPGDHLCNSGNAGLGLAVLCLIIYLIVRKKGK